MIWVFTAKIFNRKGRKGFRRGRKENILLTNEQDLFD
jgi:hypothetical protein